MTTEAAPSSRTSHTAWWSRSTGLNVGWRWTRVVVLEDRTFPRRVSGQVGRRRPADLYAMDPDCEARVLGDERFVGVEFDDLTASTFARQRASSNGCPRAAKPARACSN